MKKVQKIAALFLAVVLVVIAGCSSATPPKEALQEAMVKTSEASSYAMKMSFGLDELEIPQEAVSDSEAAAVAGVLDMVKGASITVDAVYQKEPMRTDMKLEILLPGDMEMKLTVPMIMSEETLYVKIPQIPMLPLPEELTSRFIKLDLKELAEQQGTAVIKPEEQLKLGKDIAEVLYKNFDEKTYFTELKTEDAKLPEGLKADRVIVMEVNENNYAQTVETVVNNVLPEIIDLLLKNEDMLATMQLEKADLETIKSDYETNKAELLETLKNDIKFNTLKITDAIQDGFIVYQEGKINVEATDPESAQKMKLGVHFDVSYSDINKAPAFENEIPTDAITIDELNEMFGGSAF